MALEQFQRLKRQLCLPALLLTAFQADPLPAQADAAAIEAIRQGDVVAAVESLAHDGEDGLLQAGLVCVQALELGCTAARAVALLEPAAQSGGAELRYALALALLALDAPQRTEAAKWLEAGVDAGHGPSQLLFATLLEADEAAQMARAAPILVAAARGGLVPAQTRLGALYEAGRGVVRDGGIADRWYRAAAEAGHFEAQYALGMMHMLGEVVEVDYFEGLWWLEKAAEAGHARAQDALGRAYHGGFGVRQDPEEALRWFLRAAEQGLPVAQMNAGVLFERNFHVRNWAAAAHWYLRAALQGYGPAMIALADLYRYGEGVPQSLTVAQGWYAAASESDDGDIAEQARGRMLSATVDAGRVAIGVFGFTQRFPTPGELFDAILSAGIMESVLFPNAAVMDPELEAAFAAVDRQNRAAQQRHFDLTMDGMQMSP